MGVSPQEFRSALGQWPSGVSVVTSTSGRAPVGMTVSAFISVSIEPPLIAVCLEQRAKTLAAIVASERFAVNVLSVQQWPLSDRFALEPELSRFDGVALREEPAARSPLLQGAVAQLDCELAARHRAGDHVLCIGRVRLALSHAGDPLLFQGSRYHRLATLHRTGR